MNNPKAETYKEHIKKSLKAMVEARTIESFSNDVKVEPGPDGVLNVSFNFKPVFPLEYVEMDITDLINEIVKKTGKTAEQVCEEIRKEFLDTKESEDKDDEGYFGR